MNLSEHIDFRPDRATLAAVLDELEELGPRSGGAVDARARRAALAAYENAGRERVAYPPRWRHDYAALSFDDLVWSTGRARVAARPRFVRGRARDEGADEPSALADENAGGIVHAGSTYLEPAVRLGDARITLASLADARRTASRSVDDIHGRIVAPGSDRFTALATAFQNCGAYVEIPSGIAPAAPIQILWSAQPGGVRAVFPHTVVRVGSGARATIVERHVGDLEAFVCGIVEIELGAGAELDYVTIQQADDGTRLFFRRIARCASGARIGWHSAEIGGALSRLTFGSELSAARANAESSAFFFAHAFSHVDLAIEMEHTAAETTSQTIVRGAAVDRGHGRFAGTIHIPNDARHCVASMRDDGLVLSRDAYLDARPTLEIGTSDVSAYHAASVGSLDEDQLFYVQSRGIARSAAARMIALAFFEPAIERFPGSELRDELRTALDERLDDVPETFAS
jgi:Fe-S cluster assembly protein SufD